MKFYINFRERYSHRFSGVRKIALRDDHNGIVLYFKDGHPTFIDNDNIESITAEAHHECYIKEKIIAAIELGVHPRDIYWCEDCNDWVEKLW